MDDTVQVRADSRARQQIALMNSWCSLLKCAPSSSC